MADSIGRIIGSGYGINNGFARQNKEDVQQEAQAQAPEVKQEAVDPSKVMAFLEANNIFVSAKSGVAVVEPDAKTKNRVAASIADFERFMSVATEEVGDESLALLLADAYSEK